MTYRDGVIVGLKLALEIVEYAPTSTLFDRACHIDAVLNDYMRRSRHAPDARPFFDANGVLQMGLDL